MSYYDLKACNPPYPLFNPESASVQSNKTPVQRDYNARGMQGVYISPLNISFSSGFWLGHGYRQSPELRVTFDSRVSEFEEKRATSVDNTFWDT